MVEPVFGTWVGTLVGTIPSTGGSTVMNGRLQADINKVETMITKTKVVEILRMLILLIPVRNDLNLLHKSPSSNIIHGSFHKSLKDPWYIGTALDCSEISVNMQTQSEYRDPFLSCLG